MQARLMLRLHHLILISIHWHSWLYCEYLVQCSCLFFCHNDWLSILFSVLTACFFSSWLLLRLVKLSLPNYGDFELLFSQIQQFITICSKEQIQFAGDKCKSLSNYSVWGRFVCLFFFSNNIFIFVVYSCSPVSFHNALLSGSQAGKILF